MHVGDVGQRTLHLYTKFEIRRLSRFEDMDDFRSRHCLMTFDL